MLSLAHALTGGLIAYKIGNPAISLPLSFFSHFVVDLLPHWNPHLSKEKKKFGHIKKSTITLIFVDAFAGLVLGLLLACQKLPDIKGAIIVVLGCFLGVLPDLIESPYFFFNSKERHLKKLIKFQGDHQSNVSVIPGLIFQAVYIAILLLLAF